ncbi:hypothetical protein BGZ70_004105 [Mortierella alpina]|uniref:J domain-containing protein n=1 Tax=Mortierella alpina TaxID=64518 RepID=A0A9P6M4Y8_MORAP|nr:hypothetical protein BGZ70_004105 [Mortierella alpina]
MLHYRHYRPHMGLLARAAKCSHPHGIRPAVATAAAATSFMPASSPFHTTASNGSRHNNHYEQLGLNKDATKKEIKSAFYKLSKQHHPDKNASPASRQTFLSINEAYSVLGNDRQRRDYDLTLLDRTGTLYSSSSSQRSAPTRGTLRRTPFRHSPQSAAAAAAARSHAAFRPTFGRGVPHFDSKSHQEMHYEQDIRREERRRAREQASEDYQRRQSYEQSNTATGKIFRATFVFMTVLVATSFMRAFADEDEAQEDDPEMDPSAYVRFNHSRVHEDDSTTFISRTAASEMEGEESHSPVISDFAMGQALPRMPPSFS